MDQQQAAAEMDDAVSNGLSQFEKTAEEIDNEWLRKDFTSINTDNHQQPITSYRLYLIKDQEKKSQQRFYSYPFVNQAYLSFNEDGKNQCWIEPIGREQCICPKG